MTSVLAATPLSVLDRSRIREGQDAATSLRDTVRFAQQVEALGYHRFWVAEHHGVPGVAGSAPTVLAAAVAAATSVIRVGTGGVMLPNHRPLVVAEQFGVLESLHPGRIDMGIGRSVGFTDGVRRALGREENGAEDFAGLLAELLEWFSGGGTAYPGVRARPADGLRVPPYVLATGEGAAVAAAAGVPLVIGAFRGHDRMLAAIDGYRSAFRPSRWSDRPYVIFSGTVAVAATEEAAHRLLIPEAWSMAYSRTHGDFPPLASPERIEGLTMTAREREFYEAGLRGHIAGTEEGVARALAAVIADTGADEVLVTTSTYDRAALLDSYGRLAGLAGLGPTAGPGAGRRG
ncbi:MsnO8 family LLM class oxidoreductase [Streptomyces sp. NPDC020965]|uniref:MsnO8 family LLM class oxidoreductase n=1 Tax=Streptomyces sp. NPDC020965 TaxID=3365105 RepID=UPI0037A2B2F6